MRFVPIAFCALALAYPAAAQTTNFAHLSALDAAVFVKPPQSRMKVVMPQYDLYRPRGRVTFTPIAEDYGTSSLFARIRQVRRYGGIVSTPLFGTGLTLEGEGARDLSPGVKGLELGRLRVSKEFSGGSAGLEVGAYRGFPSELGWLKHDHIPREYTVGAHVTYRW